MSRNLAKTLFPTDAELRFDEVIDVRSPGEFLDDHVSGAINLPVLDDEERVRIGTLYKQISPFAARKVGAALVSRNIANHLESHFASKEKDYRPLLYCWRGGQRSGSLGLVLAETGWQTTLIEGGYKTYRAHVVSTLKDRSSRCSFIVLNGFTGAGKTLLLRALAKIGEQTLDLEELASHKGSVFGGDPESPQPAQKRFESLLYDRLSRFDESRPVFLEAESSKIGRLNLPNPLWQKMKLAPVIEIVSPLAARANHLTADYQDWLGDPERVMLTIDRLKGFHSDRTLAGWKALSDRGEWQELVTRLLAEHYDRRYSIGGSGHFEVPTFSLDLPLHDAATVRKVAALLVERANVISGSARDAGAEIR